MSVCEGIEGTFLPVSVCASASVYVCMCVCGCVGVWVCESV